MRVIGLTGGIGSGKSTAGRYLAELGAAVMDLDKAGHEVLRQGNKAYRQAVDAFGKDIMAADGGIDRARLGKVVFNDRAALERLNKIVHPAIDEMVAEKIKEYRKQGVKVLVLEAAAMLEAKRAWQADEIWVTAAPEDAVVLRIKDRPDYSVEVVRSRIRSQMTNAERIKKADVLIENGGTPDELKQRVKMEWEKLQERL
ncbi:MAG: dephospho-CoA kinase [Dehalococcoidales bacterium]|jgi:dephospho-CoA kinase